MQSAASPFSTSPFSSSCSYDVAVVGAGPAGLAAALAIAHVAEGSGRRICLIGPPPEPASPQARDTRTAALMESSIALLERLGIWEGLRRDAAPLEGIRIVDAAHAVYRAPEVLFRAEEIGLAAFGYNIPNPVLVQALYAAAAERLEILPLPVAGILPGTESLRLATADGREVETRLVVGADGRHSICRAAAGIAAQEWQYPQIAIATSFRHARPHRNVSTEFHRKVGPLTTVPLPDPNRSSLIYVAEPAESEELMAMDDESFCRRLEEHLAPVMGEILGTGPRASFPVAGLSAKALAGPRTALVGESAHILPPIGAQGLNLGLRDAAWLAERLKPALQLGGDPGSKAALAAYADARKIDVMTRTVGVDLLNRSLLSSFAPMQAARGAVLHGLKTIPAFRRLAMRAGIAPANALPELMRKAG